MVHAKKDRIEMTYFNPVQNWSENELDFVKGHIGEYNCCFAAADYRERYRKMNSIDYEYDSDSDNDLTVLDTIE